MNCICSSSSSVTPIILNAAVSSSQSFLSLIASTTMQPEHARHEYSAGSFSENFVLVAASADSRNW